MPPVPNATAYCADDEFVAIITEYLGGNSSRTVSDVRYMFAQKRRVREASFLTVKVARRWTSSRIYILLC